MPEREVGARIRDGRRRLARARHEEHARTGSATDERMLSARRAVHEVPRPEGPLLTLDEQQALAGKHEEILLIRLAVVHRRRLTGLDHAEPEAEVRKPGH